MKCRYLKFYAVSVSANGENWLVFIHSQNSKSHKTTILQNLTYSLYAATINYKNATTAVLVYFGNNALNFVKHIVQTNETLYICGIKIV